MAFRVVRQRREARRQAKLDDIFTVSDILSGVGNLTFENFQNIKFYNFTDVCANSELSEHALYLSLSPASILANFSNHIVIYQVKTNISGL